MVASEAQVEVCNGTVYGARFQGCPGEVTAEQLCDATRWRDRHTQRLRLTGPRNKYIGDETMHWAWSVCR